MTPGLVVATVAAAGKRGVNGFELLVYVNVKASFPNFESVRLVATTVSRTLSSAVPVPDIVNNCPGTRPWSAFFAVQLAVCWRNATPVAAPTALENVTSKSSPTAATFVTYVWAGIPVPVTIWPTWTFGHTFFGTVWMVADVAKSKVVGMFATC